MRKIIFWAVLLLGLALPVFAQDTGYAEALRLIAEARLTEATRLDLSGLGLTELPPEIGELNSLNWLHLGTNQLHSLPAEIGQLSNLAELDISHNQLTTLPAEIGQLGNLQHLDAWDNQLVTLPREMGNLYQLQWLNLSQNQLESLPLELLELQVQWMGLHDNPFPKLPPEVVAGQREAMLDYLRVEARAGQQSQRLMLDGAIGIGLVATVMMGFRWQNGRKRKEKAKRG